MRSESAFDDLDDLAQFLDHPLQIERPSPSKEKPPLTERYDKDSQQWHRTQAVTDVLVMLQKGLSTILDFERQHQAGKKVEVRPVDIKPLLGIKDARFIRRRLSGNQSTHNYFRVFQWVDVRSFVINRFTQYIMHQYLAALE